MNKKQGKQLQLILTCCAIAAANSILIGWIARDLFGLSAGHTSIVAFLLLSVLMMPSIFKIQVSDDGKIESREEYDAVADDLIQSKVQNRDQSPKPLRRALLYGLLIGIMAGLTVIATAVVYIVSRLGVHGLNKFLEKDTLMTFAWSALGTLVVGVMLWLCLEYCNRWKT